MKKDINENISFSKKEILSSLIAVSSILLAGLILLISF